MRWPSVLGTVALTEVMAHFLSVGWGLMTLLAAFAWVALSGATVAAKARGTEARLNNLIPTVFPNTGGTINGPVTVNGSHTVNGNHTVSGTIASGGNVQVGSLLTGAGGGTVGAASLHSNGTILADSALNSNGSMSVNGSASVGGNHTVSGTIASGGNVQVGNLLTGSGGGTVGTAGIHSNGTVLADGSVQGTTLYVNGQRVAPGQGTPVWYQITTAVSTAQLAGCVNNIVSELIAAGIMS
jgi:hypothetical protein